MATPKKSAPPKPPVTPDAKTGVKAVKSALPSAPKPKPKSVATKSAAASKPVAKKPAAPAAAAKPKKAKIVRDSFTIPKAEYLVLDELKQRSNRLARPAKKSELLRAGIKALAGMSDAALLAAVAAVPSIKTGRPKTQKT